MRCWHDHEVSLRDDEPPGDEPPGDAPPRSTRTRRRRTVLAVVAAIAILATGVVVVLVRSDDPDVSATGERGGPGGFPAGVLSPDGQLPDGFVIPDDAVLVGPVRVSKVDAAGEPAAWFALLAVVGDDPLGVWSDYVGQFPAAHPDLGLDADTAPGCRPYDSPRSNNGSAHFAGFDPLCELHAGRASAALTSVSGDVTGHWLLRVSGNAASDRDADAEFVWPGGEAPPPQPARARPGVGEPLAPATTAYDNDDERYVLLDDSELVAQYGVGSLTGGFGVMLRVSPGADVADVAAAYADQAVQDEGEPVPPPDVVEYGGTTFSTFLPPGGAGGYSGTVTAVDQADGDDYVFYGLAND